MDFREMQLEMEKMMDKEFEKELDGMTGKMTVNLNKGKCEIHVDGNHRSFAMMASNVIGAFYSHLLDHVKEDVENPEEEVKKSVYELVDISIEIVKDNRKLKALAEKAKDATSGVDFFELLLEAAKIINDKGERK